MSNALRSVVREVAIACDGKTVTIELICFENYGAQVVFDDVRSRLKSGEGLSLIIQAKEITEGGPTP